MLGYKNFQSKVTDFKNFILVFQDQIILAFHLLIHNYFLCLQKEGALPVEMWWNDPSPPQSRTSADWWQTSLSADLQWTPLDCRVSSLDRRFYTQNPPELARSLLDGPLAKPAGKKEEHFNFIKWTNLIFAWDTAHGMINQFIKALTNQYFHWSISLHNFGTNIIMKTITRRRATEHSGVCFIDF